MDACHHLLLVLHGSRGRYTWRGNYASLVDILATLVGEQDQRGSSLRSTPRVGFHIIGVGQHLCSLWVCSDIPHMIAMQAYANRRIR